MTTLFRSRAARSAAAIFVAAALGSAAAPKAATPEQLASIRAYIRETWKTLTRSNAQLAAAAVDPKFKPGASGRWPVYAPHGDDLGAIEQRLRRTMSAADLAKIELRSLPEEVSDNAAAVRASQSGEPGLLVLPEPYVVPGGRFNEMYGWDSYFIQVGLLQDGEDSLAKSMTDNFLYEIRNYGKILNANRTYYLTRSQPPFLTEMVLAVYRKTGDKEWLRAAIPAIEKYYAFWMNAPHLTPETGLSRYFDLGEGPALEVLSDEKDDRGRTHYDRIREYLRTHAVTDFDVSQYYNRKTGELTPAFYKGDRSMRESGVDPSNRFGAFNLDIVNYNPVCLNSLLFRMENETAEILTEAGRPGEAGAWRKRAETRARKVNELLWDERDGLFYDYNLQTRKRRQYPYLSAFYPLWAGLASKQQAARVVGNLARFEKPGGLETSTAQTGNQWDAPFGWAPLEIIAVQGLRRYGYDAEADRITGKFLSMILQEFLKTHTIVEKFDVVKRSSDVSAIGFGYKTNVVGFGWTNAAFTKLYAELPEKSRGVVLRMDWGK